MAWCLFQCSDWGDFFTVLSGQLWLTKCFGTIITDSSALKTALRSFPGLPIVTSSYPSDIRCILNWRNIAWNRLWEGQHMYLSVRADVSHRARWLIRSRTVYSFQEGSIAVNAFCHTSEYRTAGKCAVHAPRSEVMFSDLGTCNYFSGR